MRLTGSSALAASTIIINLVRIVSTVFLTRLLSPDVYGITGMVVSVFYMINMVTDIGLQAYVVRHNRTDEPLFLDSVFTIHALRGVVLAAIGVLLAWPLSLLLAKPQLAAPLAVASVIFIIDGQVSLHQFRGLRDGQVQRFAALNVVTGVAQTLSAIVFAFFVRNVWAIVASMIVGSAVRAWATYAFFSGRRHSFRPDREVATDLWRFSRVIGISSALTLLVTQVDKLAMGRVLPLGQFGIYVIAASLASAPTAFAFNYESAIVYPAVAAAWRKGDSIADAYYRCWGRFFYLYVFATGGLIGGADLLVRLLYDPRYLAAARYLSILAIGTAFTILTRSMEAVEVARGRPTIGIELNIARIVWLIGGGLVAIFQSAPIIFVFTIGLVETPVYLFAALRLSRIHVFRLHRELSLGFALIAGIGVGRIASLASRFLFPN